MLYLCQHVRRRLHLELIGDCLSLERPHSIQLCLTVAYSRPSEDFLRKLWQSVSAGSI